MPRFHYTAFDARGAEKSGHLEAANAEQATLHLKAMGLYPTELAAPSRPGASPGEPRRPAPAAGPAPAARRSWATRAIGRAASPRVIATFTRQLATMLRAGMPLLRALEVLARQEKRAAFRAVIEGIAEAIRSGGTLSDGFAHHGREFDRLFVNMVKAGEASGKLDVALERLARFQEKSLHLKGKIKAALLYPVIVMGVAVLILTALLVFVVPKFQAIFQDLLKGAPLPALTQAVLGVSDFVRQHAIVAAGLVAGAWVAFRLFRRTRTGARLLDTGLIRLPPFGELFLKASVARFTRTLGTLLESGVPILQALLITRDTSGNTRIVEALSFVHDRVKEGDPVAGPLDSTGVFPPMVTSMIEVGEHTGQLPEMLTKIADIYDDEVDTAVAGLTSIIEPILITLLALIVGTIVVAILLPIVRIVQMLA